MDFIFNLTKQNVTEWEITKTDVENEMEIFIILTKKYSLAAWRRYPILVVTI